MRLENITGEMLNKALEIYCEYAWPAFITAKCEELSTWDMNSRGEDLLGFLNDESGKTKGIKHRRYTIRVGNERYPFMKQGIEEWNREGEFFLYVATNDEMELPGDDPDKSAWKHQRHYKDEQKRKIEEAWSSAGLPTLKDTKLMCPVHEGQKLAIMGENAGFEADAIAALLGEEGYQTLVFKDTHTLLEQVHNSKPDLVMLNSFLGDVPGHVIAESIRTHFDTRGVKVILIVSPLDRMDHSRHASAILPKPVTIQALKDVLAGLEHSKNP